MTRCMKNTGVYREAGVAMPCVHLTPRVEPAEIPALVLSYYVREHCDDSILFITANLSTASTDSRTTHTTLALRHVMHRGEQETGVLELGVVLVGPGEGCAVL